ncbi:hypothetical protein A2Z22_04585 [Candidatus Woesebacteria bacterium RBG_16_34_12]|uniref:Uncharacterized protein n=1 Tax=Candidatus Woesebacteria bacterium RBG_16_34_12 TaxID=1802480 RepID=A0A1F7XBM7_9BACT|nr:MAG: hypothetical protein A2Z22_04585 [Candidatus Woesebacteria bacterium RBG_16_34_12]
MLDLKNLKGFEPVALLKGFFLLVAFSVALSYIIFFFTNGKYVMPGDLYKIRAPRRIYIPFGSSLIITIIIFVILTSKLLGFILSIAMVYIAYKAIFKKGF